MLYIYTHVVRELLCIYHQRREFHADAAFINSGKKETLRLFFLLVRYPFFFIVFTCYRPVALIRSFAESNLADLVSPMQCKVQKLVPALYITCSWVWEPECSNWGFKQLTDYISLAEVKRFAELTSGLYTFVGDDLNRGADFSKIC